MKKKQIIEDIQQREYLHSAIDTDEGELLHEVIVSNGYRKTIEVGCAMGMSTLYICRALAAQDHDGEHIALDPFQSTQWDNKGREHLQEAGFDNVQIIEELSEIALPQFLDDNTTFDFGLIDGQHTFDHTLLDFFYLNRLVRVGA
jgi:predicted O-methyltransferase YrrM